MGQRAICFGLVLVLSFCGLATAGPQVDTTGPDGPGYLIGIADKLHISIWDEPTLQWHVTVRPDGKISLPLLNDVLVVGFTPEAVRLRITEEFAAFLLEPNVAIIIEEINSLRVYVLGEVNRQGVLKLQGPTRLLEVLAASEGLTQFSKKDLTILSRTPQGARIRTVVDYKRLLAGDPAHPNLFLKPGDVVLVD